MLADVVGLEISLGSTQKAWEEVSQAVAQPCQQWQEQWPREAVRNVDETGWRSNGDKRWIWTFVAKQFVFYAVASTRSAAVLVALRGTVFRDRKSTRLNSSHGYISYAVFCLKTKTVNRIRSALGPTPPI